MVNKSRHSKIHLIAGTPLELFSYSIRMKYAEVRMLENEKIGQSAAKPRTEEGSTTKCSTASDWPYETVDYLYSL